MPASIITMTMATTDEMLRLARLLTWLSPAFPTGGFAYSHGLEWSVEAGDVTDETTLRDWVADVLSHGSGRSDTILLRHAHRVSPDDLPSLCALGIALGFGRERRLEATLWGEPACGRAQTRLADGTTVRWRAGEFTADSDRLVKGLSL